MKRIFVCTALVGLLAGCHDWQSTAPFAKPLVSLDGPTYSQIDGQRFAGATRTCLERAPIAHCSQAVY